MPARTTKMCFHAQDLIENWHAFQYGQCEIILMDQHLLYWLKTKKKVLDIMKVATVHRNLGVIGGLSKFVGAIAPKSQ